MSPSEGSPLLGMYPIRRLRLACFHLVLVRAKTNLVLIRYTSLGNTVMEAFVGKHFPQTALLGQLRYCRKLCFFAKWLVPNNPLVNIYTHEKQTALLELVRHYRLPTDACSMLIYNRQTSLDAGAPSSPSGKANGRGEDNWHGSTATAVRTR